MPRSLLPQWLRVEPRWLLLLLLLAVGAVIGGSSKSDVPHMLVVRSAATVVLGALLGWNLQWNWNGLRVPLALLACFAATMLVQLIPLPPSWWRVLPGHALYTMGADLAGQGHVWRPISLTPALTFNALLALLPVAAIVVSMAAIPRARWPQLVPALLGAISFSAFFGLLQAAGLDLYFSSRVDAGLPIGVFANRNHQALFLGMSLPLLAYWGSRGDPRREKRLFRIGLSVALGTLFILLVLLTGSRTGVVVGLIGLAASPLVMPRSEIVIPRWQIWSFIGGGIAVVLLISLALTLRNTSVDRMALTTIADDMRFKALPTLVQITRDFMPFGTGFGAFDLVYKQSEPLALLHLTVFNRAHSDPLEIVMAGGVPTLIVCLAFLGWFFLTTIRRILAWRAGERAALPLLGGVMAFQIMIASIGDYPLRTPLIAMSFTLAVCFLATAPMVRMRAEARRNR